ncbi:MAG: glutaminase, partial [Synechococcaceae cyanobacterium]|nr:glutaminase [Synechococcaceae cyanobacterium]
MIATSSGRLYEKGVTDKLFTIQSVSKPFIYALGLKTLSPELMASKIDVEPSGDAFNAISLHPESGKPRNPMINAGAIAASAQLCLADPQAAEERMMEYFAELAGRPLSIDRAVYLSEKETGHRNRAIGHLLRNFAIIEGDPEPALDLYFRQCAIAVTCRDLAVMGATLACQGRNPVTGAQPLTAEICMRVLALMGTCGMYDFAG